MDSGPTTPFIPPMPEMGTGRSHHNSPVRPPVVPPFSPPQSGPMPLQPPYNAYAPPPPPPGQYLSPYAGSAYIPSPMVPGSYYMPNVQLPDGNHPPGAPLPPVGPPPVVPPQQPGGPPPGFSSDWTGYPPPGALAPGGTPWGGSQQLPPQASPWGAPPQLQPYTAYNNFQQPLPGGYPMQPGYGQWGPPPGVGPYSTPGPGYGIPLPPQGPPGWYGGAPPPGYGPPPPAQQPPRPTRVARADRGDRIDRFAAGPHYGPVLKPMLVHRMRVDVHVNPLLLPVGDTDRVHLKWNMLFPTSHCHRSGDPEHKSWSNGRQEPATFPRLTNLRLLCRALPWIIDITASNPTVGVTCGDLIDQLGDYLKTNAPKDDYHKASPDQQHQLKLNYHHNRSRSDGVPGGRLGEGLRRLDWFGAMSMWGGMDRNDAYVKERCYEVLPCVFEMFCAPRPPPSEEREREDVRHSRRRSRSSRRGSSAVNSDESS